MSQNQDCSSQLVSPEEQMTFNIPPASLYNETPTSSLSHFLIFLILTQEAMMNWTRQLLRFFLKQLIFLLATIAKN